MLKMTVIIAYLEEFLIACAPVEHLLDKDFFVGIRELFTFAKGI